MAYQDALLDNLDPTRRKVAVPGLQPSGTAMTQGGPATDPRWANGTWGQMPAPVRGPYTASPATTAPARRLPAGGNTGVTGIGLDPTMPMPPVQGPVGTTPQEHSALGTQQGQDMSWMQDAGQPLAAPAASGPRSYQDILKNYTYGAKGLGEAEGELAASGYKLQKHSDGRVRGRIFDPSGRGIDVTDTDEGQDWWSGQTGDQWGSHDAGYGSPEVTTPDGGGLMDLLQSKTGTPTSTIPTSPDDAITKGVAQYSEPSPYLKALLDQLGQGT